MIVQGFCSCLGPQKNSFLVLGFSFAILHVRDILEAGKGTCNTYMNNKRNICWIIYLTHCQNTARTEKKCLKKSFSYFQKVLQNSLDTITRIIVLEDTVFCLLPIHSTHAAKAVLLTCNFPEPSFYPSVSVIGITYSSFLKTLINLIGRGFDDALWWQRWKSGWFVYFVNFKQIRQRLFLHIYSTILK